MVIFDLVSYEDAITKEVGLKRDGVHKAIVTFGENPKMIIRHHLSGFGTCGSFEWADDRYEGLPAFKP